MTSDVEAKYDKYVILSSIKKIEPVTLVEGKEATLKDSTGRKHIDAFAEISVVNSGHGGVKSNVVRIQPPLVINQEQIDTVIDILDQSLKEVSK